MQELKSTSNGARRLPIGLCTYAISYLCGYQKDVNGQASPEPLNAYGVMDLAASHGLGGWSSPH